jgi:sugar phosphate isomerase/epimerase
VRRRIGLAALSVLELPHEEQVGVAAEAGYTDVGLRLVPVAGQPFNHKLRIAEVEKRLADTGLRVLDVEVFRLTPDTQIADFEPAFAAAARLQASDLLLHGADADASRLGDTFGRFCDLAARYGLSANLEPMPWVDVSSVARAHRVIERAGRPNSAVLVDAIHFFRCGDSLDQLSDLPMRYAQFCDAPAERPAEMEEIIRQARSDRLMPGEGGLDLPGLLRALPADLPLSLEIPYARPLPPLERARRALESTRSMLQRCASPS